MGEGKETSIEVGVVTQLAFLEFFEVARVFLVSQIIARNVVGLERERLCEVVGPAGFRLMRDGEYEVQVARGDAGLAQELEGLGRSLGGVVATEGREFLLLEGLHTEGDASYAEFSEELRFGEMEGGGIGFEVDFFQLREVKDILQPGEEVGEVFFGKQGGRATAEVNGAQGACLGFIMTPTCFF